MGRAERGHLGGECVQAGREGLQHAGVWRGCGGGGTILLQLAEEVLNEEVAMADLSLSACQAGSPRVAEAQNNFFGANADPAVQVVVVQAGGGGRATRRSGRGGGWFGERFSRGDASRRGNRGLPCLGGDHPAMRRRSTVNRRKANFATMGRRCRSRRGSGGKKRPIRWSRRLNDVPSIGGHHRCSGAGSHGDSGCVGHGVYAPLCGWGLGNIRCDLTSQLARGEQLERLIAVLFAALFASNSALVCFAHLLSGAISGIHAMDARKPEVEAIDLTRCMIGAPSSAVATHENERDGYPVENDGVDPENLAENLARSDWDATVNIASLLLRRWRE